jgi:hypothetical protein
MSDSKPKTHHYLIAKTNKQTKAETNSHQQYFPALFIIMRKVYIASRFNYGFGWLVGLQRTNIC